ncbi:MAG: TetR family transcriptional regulator C-terminal domain-containing protein [Acidobacteriota bacterium]
MQAAFHEIHRCGFRSAGLDAILSRAGVTKGALYHHFGSKGDLGLAVLDEIIRPMVLEHFLDPIEASDDPAGALIEMVRQTAAMTTSEVLVLGCPLNNLAQELSSVDETFRQRMADIFSEWQERLAECLRRGQETGRVRQNLDATSAAAFIVACWEGSISIGKTTRDENTLQACAEGFVAFAESLRPHAA